ncbi:MAG: preprotein translocase subunit SecE [Dethiobacter sp.]|nr:preprotein translocase subunit SecE [Dethiobacter sp.]
MKRFMQRLIKYFRDIRVELKKVHWPTKREFVVFTGIVLSMVVVIGLLFWGLDTVFLAVLQMIIR